MKGIKCILILSVVAFMGGCTTVSVNFDYDPGTNFNNLNTYAWASKGQEKTGDARIDNNTLFHIRIQNAINTELTLKDFEKLNPELPLKDFEKNEIRPPDFWVQYNVMVQDRADVESFGHFSSDRDGDGWSGGGGGVTTFHYTEVTLIINISDPHTKNLIWHGTGKAVVDPDASSEKKTTQINNAVAQILAKFPPQRE